MSFLTLAIYVVHLLSVIRGSLGACESCSNFVYKEQIVEKLLKTELKVKQINSTVEKAFETFLGILDEYNKTLGTFDQEFTRLKTSATTNIEQASTDISLLEERKSTPLIAFNAFYPASTYVEANQTIRFKTATVNIGDGYDNNTGNFTASIAGLYQFSAHICTEDNAWVSFGIFQDNKVIAMSYADTDKSCVSVSAVTLMEKYSRVQLKCVAATGPTQIYRGWPYGHYISQNVNQLAEDSQRRSSFNGMLLQQK